MKSFFTMEDWKYFWHTDTNVSDDFNTEEECVINAKKMSKRYPNEYSIYCYDANKYPNGDFDLEDCQYVGHICC